MIELTKHGNSGATIILNESEISSIVGVSDSYDNYSRINMKNSDYFLIRESTDEISKLIKQCASNE